MERRFASWKICIFEIFGFFKRQIFDICYKKSNLTYDTIMFKVNPETYRTNKKQYVEQDTIIEQSFTEMQRKDHNRHRYLFFRCKKLYLLNPCKDTVIRKWGFIFTGCQYSQSISWLVVNSCMYRYLKVYLMIRRKY